MDQSFSLTFLLTARLLVQPSGLQLADIRNEAADGALRVIALLVATDDLDRAGGSPNDLMTGRATQWTPLSNTTGDTRSPGPPAPDRGHGLPSRADSPSSCSRPPRGRRPSTTASRWRGGSRCPSLRPSRSSSTSAAPPPSRRSSASGATPTSAPASCSSVCRRRRWHRRRTRGSAWRPAVGCGSSDPTTWATGSAAPRPGSTATRSTSALARSTASASQRPRAFRSPSTSSGGSGSGPSCVTSRSSSPGAPVMTTPTRRS